MIEPGRAGRQAGANLAPARPDKQMGLFNRRSDPVRVGQVDAGIPSRCKAALRRSGRPAIGPRRCIEAEARAVGKSLPAIVGLGAEPGARTPAQAGLGNGFCLNPQIEITEDEFELRRIVASRQDEPGIECGLDVKRPNLAVEPVGYVLRMRRYGREQCNQGAE